MLLPWDWYTFAIQFLHKCQRSKMIFTIFIHIDAYLKFYFKYFNFKLRDVSLNSSSSSSNETTYLQHIFVNTVNVTSNISTTLCIIWITLYGTKISINLRIKAALLLILAIFTLTTILTRVNTDTWQSGFFIITIISVIFINGKEDKSLK